MVDKVSEMVAKLSHVEKCQMSATNSLVVLRARMMRMKGPVNSQALVPLFALISGIFSICNQHG